MIPELPGPVEINMRDVELSYTRGSGPGGQHRNKVESAVVAVHRPSGLRVRAESSRSQHQNRELALRLLAGRLKARGEAAAAAQENDARRQQVGSGMRGDKVRTYREQDDVVKDHRTGKKARFEEIRKGFLEKLW